MSDVELTTVLKAQLDAEFGSTESGDLRTIEETLLQAGIDITADGEVHLRKLRPPIPALSQEETEEAL